MHLTLDTMPRPLSFCVVDAMYRSEVLNPFPDPNARGIAHTAGKVVRALARGGVWFSLGFLNPIGSVYHLGAASYYKLRAWRYLQGPDENEYLRKVQQASMLAFEHLCTLTKSTFPEKNAFYKSASTTVVQVNEMTELRENAKIFHEQRHYPDGGFRLYQFKAKRLYSFQSLVQAAEVLRRIYNKNFKLNDVCVLRHVHRNINVSWDDLFRVERVELKPIQRPGRLECKPVDRISRSVLGWAISAIAFTIFSFLGLRWAIPVLINASSRFQILFAKAAVMFYLLTFPLSLLFNIVAISRIKILSIDHRGKMLLDCHEKASGSEEQLYWLYRAARTGCPEAMRRYGLYQLTLGNSPKEGLDLLYAAAVNANCLRDYELRNLAILDLKELLKPSDNLFPLTKAVNDASGQPRQVFLEGDELAKALLVDTPPKQAEEESKAWHSKEKVDISAPPYYVQVAGRLYHRM
jgi:hypothetical protein